MNSIINGRLFVAFFFLSFFLFRFLSKLYDYFIRSIDNEIFSISSLSYLLNEEKKQQMKLHSKYSNFMFFRTNEILDIESCINLNYARNQIFRYQFVEKTDNTFSFRIDHEMICIYSIKCICNTGHKIVFFCVEHRNFHVDNSNNL